MHMQKQLTGTTFKTYSFGCRVNMAEEQAIQQQMMSNGFRWKDEKPDICIINTCAVTDKAEREVRQLLYQIKKKRFDTFIAATGCATTNWQQQAILGKLPIDLPVDNVHKEFLVAFIKRAVRLKEIRMHIKVENAPHKFISSGRYLLKIQDGCHRFCTFCIVPYLRGLPKSTSIAAIVQHINTIPDSIKEVIVTAINTEAYGRDTGERFLDLIKTILSKTSIQRISFDSIHPWSITGEFLAFYRNEVKRRAGLSGRLVDFF